MRTKLSTACNPNPREVALRPRILQCSARTSPGNLSLRDLPRRLRVSALPALVSLYHEMKLLRHRRIAGALLFATMAAGCSMLVDHDVSVRVDPPEVELAPRETERFQATVEGVANTNVTWSASGGTFTVEGNAIQWTAPAVPGEYTLTAASAADPSRSGTALVRVVEPKGVAGSSFTGYRGTAASLPSGFFVAGENGKGLEVSDGYNPFTGVSNISSNPPDSFDGFGAFSSDGERYSFGMRERGSADLRDARLFLRYTNSTGRAISGFEVEYDVEVWRLGERANRIRLKFSTDSVGFSALPDIVSTPNPRGSVKGAAVGTVIDGTKPENRVAVRAKFDLTSLPGPGDKTIGSLAAGATGYFRWQYSNAEGDTGSVRSALGINNVRVVPIFTDSPAPGTSTAPLAFSHNPGFYTEPFQLELTSALKNAQIYYTTDGSVPDPARVVTDAVWATLPIATRQRTFVYQNPVDVAALTRRANDISLIPTNVDLGVEYPPAWAPPAGEVEKAAVIRAVVVRAGRVEAQATRSFFIAAQGRRRYTLPVVSLATNRANFFSPDSGIYVPGNSEVKNYDLRGSAWERAAHMELFDIRGSRPVAQELGVRTHGGGTRGLPQKSLRLYARSEYGTSRLRYRFFPSKPINNFNRILLRNGGNDWWAGLMRNPVVQTLVQHLSLDAQHYQPTIVFINGEYWGLHNFRDRLDADHLETHYGIPRDQVTILDHDRRVVEGKPGDEAPFREFLTRVSDGQLKSMSDFDRYMDVSQYLDYLITQMYAANTDWPQHNVLLWRYSGPDIPQTTGPRDGRWRWMLSDVDRSLGFHTTKATNMVKYLFVDGHEGWMEPSFELPRALIAVPEIRAELLQRSAVHLATTFHETRVKTHIESTAAVLAPEVAEHIVRWRWPQSVAAWKHHVGVMLDFAADRPGIFRNHVVNGFEEVSGTAVLEVSNLQGGGDVFLHTVKLSPTTPGVTISGGRWSGRLFTGLPVVLRSDKLDLTRVEVAGGQKDLVRTKNEVRFVLTGDARVTLP